MKGEESFRVCKSFYLSTLTVSQTMIYGVHEKKEEDSGIVKPDIGEKTTTIIKSRKKKKEK